MCLLTVKLTILKNAAIMYRYPSSSSGQRSCDISDAHCEQNRAFKVHHFFLSKFLPLRVAPRWEEIHIPGKEIIFALSCLPFKREANTFCLFSFWSGFTFRREANTFCLFSSWSGVSFRWEANAFCLFSLLERSAFQKGANQLHFALLLMFICSL